MLVFFIFLFLVLVIGAIVAFEPKIEVTPEGDILCWYNTANEYGYYREYFFIYKKE